MILKKRVRAKVPKDNMQYQGPSKRRKTKNRTSYEQDDVSETEQLALALENSKNETTKSSDGLKEIQQMKVYYPTEEEFANPLTYIESLVKVQGARDYGCVKIVPPPSFKPAMAFDKDSD